MHDHRTEDAVDVLRERRPLFAERLAVEGACEHRAEQERSGDEERRRRDDEQPHQGQGPFQPAVGPPEIEEIFLTHLHADHVLGLPGMLKTFALRGREEPGLTVYGPRGVRDLFGHLKPFLGRLPYRLTTVELAPGEALERGEYRIEPFAVDHGVSAVGYALVEEDRPGRFDVGAADALGVPPGPERGML